jgi:hypothetical protein
MTGFEIVLSGLSIAAATASVVYVLIIIPISGRDRPNDPYLVSEFVRTAPLEKLKSIYSE